VSELGIAPAQINPNGYRVIIALIALWNDKFSCDPPVEVLRYHLRLKKNISTTKDPIEGFYCIVPQRPAIVLELPSPIR
ncbi:hypothetical protein PSY31_23955, partial [Shigella flexneri]|nr:hypothetical protein [Shigella flexneri]